MDDRVVEEVKLHQETIATDVNSPLHQIREKELEISGRVLTAKRQADEIIAVARKKAAELMSVAEAEGGIGAADREKTIGGEADREAKGLRDAAESEASAIGEQSEVRRAEAVRMVLKEVASV